jgi:hypothetical protein
MHCPMAMHSVNFFQPNTWLFREFDGEYTLLALTMTPNRCWRGGPALAAPPANVKLPADVQPVTLELRYDGLLCFQVLKPVRHWVSNLDLSNKNTLTAFVTYGDQILGSASMNVSHLGGPGQGRPADESMVIDTSDWYAWVNRMPGPGAVPTLLVTGSVTLPTPGYDVSLVRVPAPAAQPRQLILRLEVRRLPGVWPQVVTTKSVRYEESPYKDAYDRVIIQLPGGGVARLNIDETF